MSTPIMSSFTKLLNAHREEHDARRGEMAAVVERPVAASEGDSHAGVVARWRDAAMRALRRAMAAEAAVVAAEAAGEAWVAAAVAEKDAAAGEAYEELMKLYEEEAIGDEVDRRYVAGLKEELEERETELEGVKEERDSLKEEVEELKSRNREMECMLACDAGDEVELKHRVDKRDAELDKVKEEMKCARLEN